MNTPLLLLATLALPALMLLGSVSARLRKILAGWLWVAPLPALTAAIFGTWGVPVVLSDAPFHVTLLLDGPGAMLLAAAALLWIGAGFYAVAFFRGKSQGGCFPVCWLFTLIGSLGIFLATDLIGFLVFYALVSLPAYGLVIYDGTPEARRAGSLYMGFALLGENLLLLAIVLLAFITPDGSLKIADGVSGMQTSPYRDVILTLLVMGFGMKIALLPMHFWMPLSYTAAPIPAAAVLSGAAVKAGVIGLVRFLPFDLALPAWGELLTLVGLAGAFYGVVVGITQTNPKTILAYSSVSQMGFLAAVLGMGLSLGDAGVAPIAAFYAAHHVLVKGALFLAVGVAGRGMRSMVLVPGAVIALGLAGLPLTGGALAKLAVKDSLGYGIVATLASLSAVGTALLMMHFLRRIAGSAPSGSSRPSLDLLLPWLLMALLCLVFPWVAYPLSGLGPASEIMAPDALWKTFWPVAAGVLLSLALGRWGHRLPSIPAGDILALGGGVARLGSSLGAGFERADRIFRLWPVACLSLLVAAVILTLAMVAG